MVAAAMLILIGGATLLYYLSSTKNQSNDYEISNGWVTVINHSPELKKITLDDGSNVDLYKGALIKYPKNFTSEFREVYLEGEAFFNVKRDSTRAFFVYNDNIVTEVLGTSFDIRIRDNKIEVVVKTGRVAVYEKGKRMTISEPETGKSNKVIITPNQKVTYDHYKRNFVTSIADAPDVISPADEIEKTSFLFDETPVSEVFKAIEKTYGLEIYMENEKMNLCPFTGDISKHDLYTKLKLICQALHAKYVIDGVRIIIKGGKECN
jgi:ferric-dicitrate binding protein FerR (iron transport regulator)